MSDPLRTRIDDDTLREVDVDVAAVQALAEELDGAQDAASLARRTVALRLLGRLGDAETCGRAAVTAAERADDVAAAARAHVRLGTVLHWLERYDEAEDEFAVALSDAAQLGDEQLRAFALQHRGKARFDQGRVGDAERDFTGALQILRRTSAPEDEVCASEQAVTAAMRRLVEAGHR